jgi:oligopeptide/dipeptide ABC transporter ATP-binding protein
VPLLRVEGLHKSFTRTSGAPVHAVNGVSFDIRSGETVGLIGESGSGKSTIGRLLLRLIEPDDGRIEFDGNDLRGVGEEELRRIRASMQIVFQEPYESLNPRMRVADIVREPLDIHAHDLSRDARNERVVEGLHDVGLNEDFTDRFPKALSGGQQQRIGIARAIVTRPKLVILDEPTSSLDLSVRAQILELLKDLQSRFGLSYLFISHDLATVGYISDRIAVLYLGQIRESGPTEDVVNNPRDPYTQALLSATLDPDPDAERPHRPLGGEIPSPTRLPEGCFLYGRCPIRIDACRKGPIELRPLGPDRDVRCIRADGPDAKNPWDGIVADAST